MKKGYLSRLFANGIILISIAISLTACSKNNEAAAQTFPKVITFTSASLYPESFSFYSQAQSFVVGSVKHGTIGTVDRNGNYVELPGDPAWVSTFGIKVSGDFAYVCIGDLGNSLKSSSKTTTRLANVVKYDLRNKKVIQTYDLSDLFSGPIFPNDLALDNNNNIYVTESLTGFLYKIDSNGKASIFLQNDLFKGQGFNLNGIAYDNAGFLLVDKTNDGKLFKINISDKSVATVNLPAPIVGADGIFLTGESLYVVNYLSGMVTAFKSVDSWKSAQVASQYATDIGSTAATQAGLGIYILNSKVTEIVNNPATALSNTYTIKQYVGK